MERIPEIVKEFVAKHVHSIDVLEILLLVRQEPRKEWTALAVSKALLLERASVAARLEHLLSAGLLQVREGDGERIYSYSPSTEDLAAAVNDVAKWYASHRVAIISLVFSSPSEEIRPYPDVSGERQNEDK